MNEIILTIKREFNHVKKLLSNISGAKDYTPHLQEIAEGLKKKSEYEVEIEVEEIRALLPKQQDIVKEVVSLIPKPKNANEFKIFQRLKKEIPNPIDTEKLSKEILAQVPKAITKKEVEKIAKGLIPKKKDIQQIIIKQKELKPEEFLKDLKIIEMIARGLEKLRGKARLDAYALKNLPIPSTFGTISTGGGGTNVQVVDVSSQCDGVTTSFLLPAYSSILMVIITGWAPNGILRPTVDFTTPDNTHIALVTSQVSAPVSGTTLIVLYVPA